MSKEFSDYPGPRPGAERRSDRSAEAIRQFLYEETIDLVYDGIAEHLQADMVAAHSLDTTPGFIGAYVQHDVLTAPRHNDQLSTFCTRLEPDVPDEEGVKYLELHIPSSRAEISEFEMPPRMDIREVYVRVGFEKRSFWYVITRDFGLYEYIPAAQRDDEIDAFVAGDESIWQAVSERVSVQTETAMHLLRRIINWRTVPQPASGMIVDDVPDII